VNATEKEAAMIHLKSAYIRTLLVLGSLATLVVASGASDFWN
jgi:hypothetical protein